MNDTPSSADGNAQNLVDFTLREVSVVLGCGDHQPAGQLDLGKGSVVPEPSVQRHGRNHRFDPLDVEHGTDRPYAGCQADGNRFVR